MKMLYLAMCWLLLVIVHPVRSQILHSESFAVILDSSKWIKGSVVPDLKFQTQKKDLLEFENNANISMQFKKHALTLANKIELSKYGSEVLLSGGYLYMEYQNIIEDTYAFEPFAQLHWSEARGLELKYAGGLYLRYRLVYNKNIGIFAGLGSFYEYERWNFTGVDETLIPENSSDVVTRNFKLGDYLSFKFKPKDYLFCDVSIYHQSRFNQIFSKPRLASSTSITYSFTEHLGLTIIYQNIYDYHPNVPIDKLFNKVVFSVAISF